MTPRPAHPSPLEPKQERSHATRQRLLDAAVDELVEHGYGRLTTMGVARRAGVSRGAQQHHFPHKALLVAEAVRHLAERQIAELQDSVARVPRGRARAERALDIMFEQYRGRLFAAIIELSLAARAEPELRDVVAFEERTIGRAMLESAADIFEPDVLTSPDFDRRWAMALSTMRGLAMLTLLGHSAAGVARQWRFTRQELVRLLLSPDAPATG